MPRPSILPTWATAALRRIEPETAEKASGFVQATRTPARKANWILGYLADWIEYLRDERDRLDTYCGDLGVQLPATLSQIRYLGTHSMQFRITLTAAAPQWSRFDEDCRSEANVASGYFNLTSFLPRNALITRVRVLVQPGAIRGTSGDRMELQLLKHTYGASFATPVTTAIPSVATARDDGTTAKQWIGLNLTGAPVAVSDGASWTAWVIAGADAGTNKDLVFDAMVEFTCDTIRNN